MGTRLQIIFACLLSVKIHADTVMLKDGSRVQGDVKRSDSGYNVTTADGRVVAVASAEIQSIQLGQSGGGDAAMDKFGSLKRSVESLDDLSVILNRFAQFIQQNKGSPAADSAQKELAIWQDRADRQMVRVAGKWVTPGEQEQIVASAGDVIRQAHDLLKANKIKEADPLIRQALAIDPTNPVANYLQGVLLARTEKIVPARKAFDAVRAQLPSDAATLNNLGAIAWRQNQFINSLQFYYDAMLAMPANKEILNNVAEAMAALKDEYKKYPVAQRASRLFAAQEAQLEATMAQYGWYRWGSTWLDQTQLDELKKTEADVKEKLDALQKQFDESQKKYRDNEETIRRQVQYMRDIEAASTYVDGKTGLVYRSNSYPQSYLDANRDVQTLQSENKSIDEGLAGLRQQAKRLEASKPKPAYAGAQTIIGVEGVPRIGILSATATTQATTAPLGGATSP